MEQSSVPAPQEFAPASIRAAGGGPVCPTGAALGRFRPLSLGDVTLTEGGELGDWQRRNSTITLPYCIEQVRAAGAVRNLERVAEGRVREAPHEGMHFSDSDIYKVLEATAWDSVRGLSPEVAAFVADVTDLLTRAQRGDGYLNSWVQGQHPELEWKDLRWGHELYCAGHLLQAATAGQRTGGYLGLAGVAERLAGHLLATFSLEDGDGRLVGVCGHPEVEAPLVEFYRLTGDARALALAKRQVELRGRADVALPTSGLVGDTRFSMSYFLHHMPVRERTNATGHAVRELYLQAGVVDVAVETADTELLAASEAIWEDLFATKTYVTGSHGSRHRDESIGDAYELPSDRAYAETCAAIASFQWNWRLLLATGRGALRPGDGARVLEHHRRRSVAAGDRVLLFEHPAPEDWSRRRRRGLPPPSPSLVQLFLLPPQPRAPHGEHPGIPVDPGCLGPAGADALQRGRRHPGPWWLRGPGGADGPPLGRDDRHRGHTVHLR